MLNLWVSGTLKQQASKVQKENCFLSVFSAVLDYAPR